MVLHRSNVDKRSGRGQSAKGIGAFFYISETYLVQWISIDVCLIGEGGGVSKPWVYVVFHRYMVD